ncbi:MASE4 domain-containing protein [Paraburkholderia kururiensis]|uniref:histidine kinase n=1 Tax=Paraburkholderia kururiensis TaxID=984307 RepID=A0ABZ0WT41_9BURK|nr:sensor histidine kinase [Paraburkholderia kururiensis]WQD80542.1 sensor histidine kinase [Paraburkholderia kururiensis]
MRVLTDVSHLFLSTLPPDRRQRRLAAVMMSASVAMLAALAPFARVQLPAVWAFIPVYETAVIVTDLVTAWLLLSQFSILRSRSLLLLAGGYLFSSLIAGAHMLSFPGLFAPSGLLGARDQTTAWLYMFWHGAFPVAVMGYASDRGEREPRPASVRGAAIPVVLCVVGVVVAAAAFIFLATGGHDALPRIMRGSAMASSIFVVVGTVWALNVAALVAVWRRTPRSVLDLCVMVVLVAWLCDIAVSAILNHGRFDLGFYAGRVYGFLASTVVLFALLFENGKLYAKTVRALEGERFKHRLVQEKTDELNEANERLEQRVAARTAELSTSNEELRREVEERQRAQRDLAASREELREMSVISASAREAEQRRIARELHDELAQTLATLRIDLEWLIERVPQDDADLARKIAGMHGLLTEAVGSTRRIAADLRPLMLDDLGFAAATQWLVENFEKRYRIGCILHIEPSGLTLAEPYATAVFRIVQESLTNIARHAQASHAEVDLRHRDGTLALTIRDDGAGFDSASARKPGSFGLVGLRERAYLVGGTLRIETSPGKGTRIEVQLPLDAAATGDGNPLTSQNRAFQNTTR